MCFLLTEQKKKSYPSALQKLEGSANVGQPMYPFHLTALLTRLKRQNIFKDCNGNGIVKKVEQ